MLRTLLSDRSHLSLAIFFFEVGVSASDADVICPPYVRDNLPPHPDWTYFCEEYNYFRPVLFESISDNKVLDYDEYAIIKPRADLGEILKSWLEWFTPLNGYPVTLDDIDCSVGQLMPRHDGRHSHFYHQEVRGINSYGLMFDERKPIKEWIDKPFRVTTRSPYHKHVTVEVDCMLRDDLTLPATKEDEIQLALMTLAEKQINFIYNGYNQIEDDLKSIIDRKTLYVEHFNVFTLPKNVGSKSDRFNVIILESESLTKHELQRLPRLQSQLISDGFSIFNKHAVSGTNTAPNVETMQNGSRDSEYRGNRRTFKYGDTSIHGGLRDAASANGYLTGRFFDSFRMNTLYWNHASRTVADIDGSFIAHSHTSVYPKMFGRVFSREYCKGNSSHGQWVAKEITNLLKISTKPLYLFVSNELVSHDSHNHSLQEAAFLDLIRGEARNELLDDTLLIIVGDHGQRLMSDDSSKDCNAYALNQKFNSEAVHPMLAVRLPNRLTVKYPFLKRVLGSNTDKLTTQLDIFETVMDVINGRFPTYNLVTESVTRPNLIRYPAFKLPTADVLFQNTINGGARENIEYYADSGTNCDLLDTRMESDTEFTILARKKLTRNKQIHPYLQYYISDDTKYTFESNELLCEKPAINELPQRIARVPDIIKKQGIDSYYPGKRWSDGYHAWGDLGISLMYRISSERLCDDFGTENYLCPCDWSNMIFDESSRIKNDDDTTGIMIGDNLKDIKIIKVTSKDNDDPTILSELKPDSSYFDDSMKINDVILREFISERCLDIIKDIPKKIYENYNSERIMVDRELSEKFCDDTSDKYFISQLSKLHDGWMEMQFYGPYGVQVKLHFQIFGECKKSREDDDACQRLTMEDVTLGKAERMDRYELTSRLCSGPMPIRWKEICVCK